MILWFYRVFSFFFALCWLFLVVHRLFIALHGLSQIVAHISVSLQSMGSRGHKLSSYGTQAL